ncbi:hypothetical protein [Streptococcus salivarius]|uniref:hypothetical protein n=1 Tax=Streptococcus salivarius TaxID=1304 RepID=UPI0034A4EB09
MSVINYDLSKGEFPSELDIAESNLINDKFRTLLDYVCRILTNDKRISIGYTCLLEFVMIDYDKQDYSFEKIEFFLPEKFTTKPNQFPTDELSIQEEIFEHNDCLQHLYYYFDLVPLYNISDYRLVNHELTIVLTKIH